MKEELTPLEREKQKLANANYFEGTLQLRNVSQDVIDYTRKRIKDDKRCLITKEKKVINGVDFLLTSQKYLQQLGKELMKKFTGEIKISRKLHTMNKVTAKKVYRVTVMFKMFPFKKGTKFKMDDKEYQVLSVVKNRAQVKNAKSGKKEWMDVSKLKDVI